MSRAGKSQYAVLGLLTLGPQTGYQLKKLFDGSLAHFWAEGFGQIYPVLKHLVAEGWAVQSGGGHGDGRGQKRYAITPEGQAALEAWLAEPAELPSYRDELLLKLFFGRYRAHGANAKDVERLRERNLGLLKRYGDIERELLAAIPGKPEAEYWLLTLHQGQLHSRAFVEWCDRTLESLQRMERSGSRVARARPAAPGKRARKS